ncbi:hypothetical protein P5V15_009332 [Pogonomyrmex californicus]
MCEQNFPVYHIGTDASCKVQIYINAPEQLQNCEQGHIIFDSSLWLTVMESQVWLYSAQINQKIEIQCDKSEARKLEINGIGKVKLNGDCKLTTPEITIVTTTNSDRNV